MLPLETTIETRAVTVVAFGELASALLFADAATGIFELVVEKGVLRVGMRVPVLDTEACTITVVEVVSVDEHDTETDIAMTRPLDRGEHSSDRLEVPPTT